MKINQLLIIVMISTLGACTSEKPANKKVHIHGEILNAPIEYALIMEDYETVKDTLPIIDGVIDTDIVVGLSRIYDFAIKNKQITWYVTPGDTVNFSLDYNNYDSTLIYSGTAKNENSLLFMSKMNRSRPQYYSDAHRQKDYFDSVYTAKIKIIDTYLIEKPKTNPKFIESQKLALTYGLACDKLYYPPYYEYHFDQKPENLDSSFFLSTDTLSLENQDLIHNREFIYYVKYYLRSKRPDKGKIEGSILTFPQQIVDTISSQIVQDYLLSSQIRFSRHNDVEQDSLFSFINEHVQTPVIRSKFIDEYEKIQSLRKGKTAVIWSAEDATGITHKLSDFSGKWVYMDVWASWCGPCIKEIPDLKALEEKYKDKNIAFVSISIDNNLANWKKALNKHALAGYQYVKPENDNKKFMTDYMVDGVPSFYLIDPQGKIYTSNPPRPSNGEKFDELMTEIQL